MDRNQSRMKIQNSKTYPCSCDSNTMQAIQLKGPISDQPGKKKILQMELRFELILFFNGISTSQGSFNTEM